MAFVTVAQVEDLPSGARIVVDVDNVWVAVFNVGGKFYAIEDLCTHDDGPLAEGDLIGLTIECPRHGATFSLETGAPTMPAVLPIARYAVQVEGGALQVDVHQRLNA